VELKKSALSSDPFVKDLLKDLEGQVTEALSKESFYNKWGRHYLPSLASAHLYQQANNFKDPGVQHYGGALFSKLRDTIDEVFCKLPPPKPSHYTTYRPSTSSSQAPAAPALTSMSTFHYSGNPCFSGDSLVLLGNGSTQRVDQVRKGDLVKTTSPEGDHVVVASVICVVKTHCFDNKAKLVKLKSGLVVTPWHPVRIDGEWQFPRTLGKEEVLPCNAVYSFVLDSTHVMIINGIECACLGHNFTDNDVVRHPYFGSPCVLQDLKQMIGWQNGLVELGPHSLKRDSQTGLVCGLEQHEL